VVIRGRGEDGPAAFIKATCVFADAWINFYFYAFDVGSVLGIDTGNFRMKKHAAVA
jgi:hypothetical protein